MAGVTLFCENLRVPHKNTIKSSQTSLLTAFGLPCTRAVHMSMLPAAFWGEMYLAITWDLLEEVYYL